MYIGTQHLFTHDQLMFQCSTRHLMLYSVTGKWLRVKVACLAADYPNHFSPFKNSVKWLVLYSKSYKLIMSEPSLCCPMYTLIIILVIQWYKCILCV